MFIWVKVDKTRGKHKCIVDTKDRRINIDKQINKEYIAQPKTKAKNEQKMIRENRNKIMMDVNEMYSSFRQNNCCFNESCNSITS